MCIGLRLLIDEGAQLERRCCKAGWHRPGAEPAGRPWPGYSFGPDRSSSTLGVRAGSGQVIDQGARLVDIALEDGSAFKLDGWKYISESFAEHTLHFIGLLSNGGVHSRIDQLLGFVRGAARDGAKRIRVHILTVRHSPARCVSSMQTRALHDISHSLDVGN